nr:hypothetical protein [Tanacetum cinerariifolium]
LASAAIFTKMGVLQASMEVLLAKERFLKLIQAWDEKQIESWSFPELLLQLLNDSQTINEMLIQREQATNLAEQEEQAAQSFTPYWNFSMIDDEEVLQSRENFMKAIQTFSQKFSRYSFGVMPKVLLIAWERFYEIKHAFTDKQYQLEEIQELMYKLLEDVRNINEELSEYNNSPSRNRPTFYNNDKEHSIQHKEYLENSSDVIAPVLPTEEPEYSLSMGEYEVTSDNKSECDVPVCEDSFNDHFEILSDSNNDDILSDDDAFEDIEYVEASELVSLEEENDVNQEEKEFDVEDILQIQDVIIREKLLSINRLIADIEFLNDNHTPDSVLKSSSSFPILEKFDNSLFYSDNYLPEFETFSDHTGETRSGSTTAHANNSLPEYDSFCFEIEANRGRLTSVVKKDISDNSTNDSLLEESSNFDHHDDPSFSRPPPELPDVEFFFDFDPDLRKLISVVKNNIDELNEDECFDPGSEIDVFTNIKDDNYFPFIFVIRIFLPYLIYPEVSPLLLSTMSEDTIFNPDIST